MLGGARSVGASQTCARQSGARTIAAVWYSTAVAATKKFAEAAHQAVRRDNMLHASVTALLEELAAIEGQIARLDEQLKELARRSPVCWRLMSVPGVSPIVCLTMGASSLLPILPRRRGSRTGRCTSRRPRRNDTPALKAKVGRTAIKGDAYCRAAYRSQWRRRSAREPGI